MSPVIQGIIIDLNQRRILLRSAGITQVQLRFTKTSTLIFTDNEASFKLLLQYMKKPTETEDEIKRSYTILKQ